MESAEIPGSEHNPKPIAFREHVNPKIAKGIQMAISVRDDFNRILKEASELAPEEHLFLARRKFVRGTEGDYEIEELQWDDVALWAIQKDYPGYVAIDIVEFVRAEEMLAMPDLSPKLKDRHLKDRETTFRRLMHPEKYPPND